MPSTSKSISLPTNVSQALFSECVLSHSELLLNSVSKQPLPFQVSAHPPRNGTMDSSFCSLLIGGSAGNRGNGRSHHTLRGKSSHHLSMHSVIWLSYWNQRVKQFPETKTYPGFFTKIPSRENEKKWGGGVGDAAGMSGKPQRMGTEKSSR